MARIKTATFFYALAVLLLPLSGALKQMLQLSSTIWIDPSIILAVSMFLLLGMPARDKYALWLAGFATLSAVVGSFFLAPSGAREHSSFYAFYAEPIRLWLDILWYLVSLEFLVHKREFVVRWLSISVVIQLSIAIYLYLALFDMVPVPNVIAIYLTLYKGRQAVMWGDTAVYRMAGTFIESPPFGLFMFCSFAIFVVSWTFENHSSVAYGRRWLAVGMIASFVGAVASLSDEVLLAIVIFGAAWYLSARETLMATHRHGKAVEAILGVVLVLGIGAYVAERLEAKLEEAASTAPVDNDVIGQPGAERLFHVRYGLARFEEVPLAVLTGIGPGRYGDYAARTGIFPPTVQIGVTPVFWLVEYGVFGLALIVAWLCNIGRRGRSAYGAIAISALFSLLAVNFGQGGWMFETWFLALAFLYTSAACTKRVSQHARIPVLG